MHSLSGCFFFALTHCCFQQIEVASQFVGFHYPAPTCFHDSRTALSADARDRGAALGCGASDGAGGDDCGAVGLSCDVPLSHSFDAGDSVDVRVAAYASCNLTALLGAELATKLSNSVEAFSSGQLDILHPQHPDTRGCWLARRLQMNPALFTVQPKLPELVRP